LELIDPPALNSQSLFYARYVNMNPKNGLSLKDISWSSEVEEGGSETLNQFQSDLSLGYPLVKVNTTKTGDKITASAFLSDGSVLESYYFIEEEAEENSVAGIDITPSTGTAYKTEF
jgi:hypothetical protein